jgi:hypothetical protein
MLLLRVVASAILLFAAGSSQATTVYWGFVDDPEFSTHWELEIDDLDDAFANTYSFVLTAETVNNPGWYTHAVLLHLDGGEQADFNCGSCGSYTAPGGNWNELDASTSKVAIEGYGDIPMNSWVGFYTNEVSPSLTDPTVNDTELKAGVALVNGGTYTWTADFTLTNPLNPFPSIQSFTYDGLNGGSGNIARRRMSETFIPEPSAAVLFAVGGLIVGGALRRRP